MYVVGSETVRRLDERTIAAGTSGSTLMERAGRGATELLRRRWKSADRAVIVICGKGNNGGDGLVVARHLHLAHIPTVALLLDEDLSGDAHANLLRARDSGVELVVAGTDPAEDLARLHRQWPGTWLVDAGLGTGLTPPLRAPWNELCAAMVSTGRRLFALDCPTGLDTTTGEVDPSTPVAELTVTFGSPKWGLFLAPGRAHCGRVEVVDIGFDAAVVEEEHGTDDALWIDARWVSTRWPRRAVDAHKHSVGSVLVAGASRSMSGAVALACNAAYRAGAGWVEAVTPSAASLAVDLACPETLVHAVEATDGGGLAPSVAGFLAERSAACDALVIGCGLGADLDTANFVVDFLRARSGPTLVDADALNAFHRTGRVAEIPAGLVLTPHSGELARLIGVPAEAIAAERPRIVRDAARRFHSVLLHKGGPTFVADADGRLAVIATGGPGLATAGSGDVLSGVIGALLAQGVPAFEAACLGAWWHGAAGDLVEESFGSGGVVASDLPEAIARVGLAVEQAPR